MKLNKRSTLFLGMRSILLSSLFFSLYTANTCPLVPAPDSILNLSTWYLTLPINNNGLEQPGTKAVTVSNTSLNAGYRSKYFYSSPDTGVVFWCPIDGATTSPGIGSDHPRTELIESQNWNMGQKASLNATLAVNQYPSNSNDIIIGQIHGAAAYVYAPFVLLHATAGSIIAYVKGDTIGTTGTTHFTLLNNVSAGANLSYSITADTANIYFTASCPGATGPGTWTAPIPAIWAKLPVRFSAGDYVQDTGQSNTDGGKITFYKLTVNHSTALPLSPLQYFNAHADGIGEVNLTWGFNTSLNNHSYKLERSDNTHAFSTIETIYTLDNSGDGKNYTYTDKTPSIGINSYRLKLITDDGSIEYSKILRVHVNAGKHLNVASNIIHNVLSISNFGSPCTASLYNLSGQQVNRFILKTGQNNIIVSNMLTKGIYYLYTAGNTYRIIKTD